MIPCAENVSFGIRTDENDETERETIVYLREEERKKKSLLVFVLELEI